MSMKVYYAGILESAVLTWSLCRLI